MTSYEILYKLLFPFALPHYQAIRSILKKEISNVRDKQITILDIGGRKSPYTIGLDLDISIIDLPQKSEVQKKLNLGLNDEYLKTLREKRSNVENVILGDFLKYEFAPASFDIITSIEVIEHVQADEYFVKRISSILKDDGIGLLTTPNGDHIKVNRKVNPDHWRHYEKAQFEGLLAKYFQEVSVFYFVRYEQNFLNGLKPWSLGKPLQTLRSMYGNLRSYRDAIDYKGADCAYLIGIVRKPIQNPDERAE